MSRNIYKILVILLTILLTKFGCVEECFGQCNGIDFVASQTKGCALLTVTFHATGTPNGTTFDWNLGNGFLTGKKDTIIGLYSNGGKYTIIMRAHLPNGDTCRVQKDTFITVIPKPVPKLKIYPDTIICDIGRVVTFLDSTPNIAKRQWIIEGNSYSASQVNYNFNKPSTQSVTLSLTDNFGCSSFNTKHIFIYDSLPIDFCAKITIADTAHVSATFSPDIVNASGRKIIGYGWSFPGGTPSSSTASNPIVTYPSAKKKYTVAMTVYTADGCGYTMTWPAFIRPFITPLFTSQCLSKSVKVSATVSGVNYQFGFPGSAQAVPDLFDDPSGGTYIVKYDDAGNFGMSLQFNNTNTSEPSGVSCPISVYYADYITALGPKANFGSNDNQICNGGDTVHFINTSNTYGATKVLYTWYVQNSHNGKTVKMGPTHTKDTFYVLTDTGFSYNVILVAKSPGCQDSIFQKAFITTGAPKSDFKVVNATTCYDGDPIILEAKPTPPEQTGVSNYDYYWDISSETDPNDYTLAYTNVVFYSPKHVGKYDVFLKISNAHCSDTITKFGVFNVLGDVTRIIAKDSVGCLSPDFKTTLSISPEKIYPANLPNKPLYHWSAQDASSQPTTFVKFSDTASSTTDIQVTAGGCYSAILDISVISGTDTCKVRYTKPICVGVHVAFEVEPFTTAFHKDQGILPMPWKCAGDTLEVMNNSDIGANSFKWTVLPKGFAKIIPNDSARNIRIAFEADTCYTVKCVATMFRNSYLCSDSTSLEHCLLGPKPNFTSASPTVYCAPAIVNFKNTSALWQHAFAGDSLSKPVLSYLHTQLYLWDFGDGTTLLTKNDTEVSHVYAFQQKSSYAVTLTAFDTDFTYSPACSNTIVKKGFVNVTGPVPSFNMTANTGCDSVHVNFTNTSTNVNKFYFFYDDGSDIDSVSLKPHTFRLQDTSLDSIIYYPTLLSRDDPNCRVFYHDTVKIYKTPTNTKITSDINVGCAPLTVHFNAISTTANGWHWDFDNDGKIDDSVQSPVFVFKKPGKYRVKLLALNHGSCPAIIYSDTINVVFNAKAAFVPSSKSFCGRADITFENKSLNLNSFIINYGDGSAQDTNSFIKHFYYFDSSKTVLDSFSFYPKLIVFTAGGCSDTTSDTIIALKPPIAGFKSSTIGGCSPLKVHFTDTSKFSFGTEWDFNNDGIIDAYGRQVDWVFYPGVYTVKLRSISVNGCVDSVVKVNLITVNDPPKADFNVSDSIICYKGEVQFTNTTTPSQKVVSWFWNFGDTAAPYNTSRVKDPAFHYYSFGWHNVELFAVDNLGCSNTIKKRSVFVVDTLPPSNTALSYVSVNDTSAITISWRRSTDPLFKYYKINRLIGGKSINIYTSSKIDDTIFNEISPAINTSGMSYCYIIQTINECDRISITSPEHCSILLSENSTIGPANALNWSSYIGWSPKYYLIFRSDETGIIKLIDSVNGTTLSYIDTAKLCDETYCYYVQAVSDSGLISRSNITCLHAQYVRLTSPLNMRYVSDLNEKQIKIQWDITGYKNLTAYVIDKYSAADGWSKNYAITQSNSFVDNNVDINNESYTYLVEARDKCGYTNPPSNIGTSILLKQKISSDNVVLNWNGYHTWRNGLKNYDLQVQLKDKSYKIIASTKDTTFTDDSVYHAIDTAYCYRVIAYENAPGNDSSVSNSTCAVLPSRVFVPNAFTPGNGDSINDEWKPSAISIYNVVGNKLKSFNVRVFNRWGSLVFEANDAYKGWDGKFKGVPVPIDVYIYFVDAEGIDGRNIHLRGNITIVK